MSKEAMQFVQMETELVRLGRFEGSRTQLHVAWPLGR